MLIMQGRLTKIETSGGGGGSGHDHDSGVQKQIQ